jgi:hypothetical protein
MTKIDFPGFPGPVRTLFRVFAQNVCESLRMVAFGRRERFLENSLIIQEENTKKNHKRVVYIFICEKTHVNLHKL